MRVVGRVELDVAHAFRHQPAHFVANDVHQVAQQIGMRGIKRIGHSGLIAGQDKVGWRGQRDFEQARQPIVSATAAR